MPNEQDRPDAARYAVSTAKAVEMVVWLAHARPGIDIYHLVKAAFFAEKDHLNRFGRPIAGDDYDAAPYGPLGRSVYALLRFDPIEMIALGGNGRLPFHLAGPQNWSVFADREPNEQVLSRSDVDALRRALDKVADLSFEDLVEETHADPAYVRAAGNRMRYEDLLDPTDPRHAEKVADLQQVARYAVL